MVHERGEGGHSSGRGSLLEQLDGHLAEEHLAMRRMVRYPDREVRHAERTHRAATRLLRARPAPEVARVRGSNPHWAMY